MHARASVHDRFAMPGQSQLDRLAPELDAHHADVDERTPRDRVRQAARLARLLNFFDVDASAPAGDWSPLFPDLTDSQIDALLARADGTVPAHLALYLAFAQLLETPRAVANAISARHADFFYGDVLRLRRREPVPDRAHLVLEAKKGAAPFVVDGGARFSGGKDSSGIELLYAPTADTVVNGAAVDSLHSVFVDRAGRGTLRFAPVANSADGLGAPLPLDDPQFAAFGGAWLPRAEIGFAMASPVLRLREGTRKITLTLRLANAGVLLERGEAISGAFDVHLTGAKGWVEADAVSASLGADGTLRVDATVPPSALAIVDYNAKTHGYAYATDAPVAQVLLRGDPATIGLLDFAGVVVRAASVAVDVSGVTSMTLESDTGTLDPKKAFQPFGTTPTPGARFMIAYPEALAKKLTAVSIALQWKDAPANFATRYAAYSAGITNARFTAAVTFDDGAGKHVEETAQLFDLADPRSERVITLGTGGTRAPVTVSPREVVRAMHVANATWSLGTGIRLLRASPILFMPPVAAAERAGFITFTLRQSFLHAEYRNLFVAATIAAAKAGTAPSLPGDPYTPTVQTISLGYRAYGDEVPISSTNVTDFANADAQFFHVTPFGPMREHGYQRARFPFVGSTDVPLLPEYTDDGELLVGITGIGAGDSVSLLFQVAPGSADPELDRQPVRWSVLCDDYWKTLGPREIARDTTNGLLASGIVALVIPREATTSHARLASGRVWIRASVARNVGAIARLVGMAANAVEVRFVDQGNAASHLETPLRAKAIAKARTPLANVKTVAQPYASFGGAPLERDDTFRARAAERLRHKDRCVTAWDYERIVLEAFPDVHRVKCIPYASDRSWSAPGNVLLVVIPDLRNRNAVDPLRPRADADTLRRIEAHVQARAGMQVRVRARNARYERVRAELGVHFRDGFEFNHYRAETEQALIRALAPWAFDTDRDVAFGGVVYRSALLDVVERLPFVDYVTDFRMHGSRGDVLDPADVPELRPTTPDAILASDATHGIVEAV